MIVDCLSCPVRDQRCEGCVVTVLLSPGPAELPLDPAELPLDPAERRAVSMFVGAGLVRAKDAVGLSGRREPLDSVDRWATVRAVG